jgi:hypothetical protein
MSTYRTVKLSEVRLRLQCTGRCGGTVLTEKVTPIACPACNQKWLENHSSKLNELLDALSILKQVTGENHEILLEIPTDSKAA